MRKKFLQTTYPNMSKNTNRSRCEHSCKNQRALMHAGHLIMVSWQQNLCFRGKTSSQCSEYFKTTQPCSPVRNRICSWDATSKLYVSQMYHLLDEMCLQ